MCNALAAKIYRIVDDLITECQISFLRLFGPSLVMLRCYKFHILTVIFFNLTLYSTLEVQLWS